MPTTGTASATGRVVDERGGRGRKSPEGRIGPRNRGKCGPGRRIQPEPNVPQGKNGPGQVRNRLKVLETERGVPGFSDRAITGKC